MTNSPTINVIGAGLAGCEAAWAAANSGCFVKLYEMKGEKMTPAHSNPDFAELVCSNSLRSEQEDTASGLLKQEMTHLGSLVLEAARATRVPAGGALSVDRERFAAYITAKIRSHPNIQVRDNVEVTAIDLADITVIATGPLTSDSLSEFISQYLAPEKLHF
ncbi:MAG: FAD-dependent oxidoreductase, partial [Oscillospiraceae bacterium]|nr:FAD-dependent oxidoreductase [Oscillospiraceae bacterium]